MFDSSTKTTYIKLTIIKRSILWIFGLFLFVFNFVWALNNKTFIPISNNQNVSNIFFNFFIFLFLLTFNFSFQSIITAVLHSKFTYETLTIINASVLPHDLPKVVYVYTTHNDFLPGRVLQNAKQTYKNYEVWISDGSDKEEIRQEIREFSKKHGFKLCQMGPSGSSTKSENLNYFLKNSGAIFDYLVISDADESFDQNFVNVAIRFFYSSNIHKLAYVTPINQTYPTRSLFSNKMRRIDDVGLWRHTTFNFTLRNYPHLFSASCLISNDFLKYINYHFPDVVAEDIYTENIAERHGWISIASPITVCTQAYDVSIRAHYKRVMRVNEWIIKLNKSHPFRLYNERHSVWFLKYYFLLFIPVVVVAGFGVIIVITWLLATQWSLLIKNIFFIPFVICVGILLFIWQFANFIFMWRLFRNFKDALMTLLIMLPYYLGYISYIIKHWFKAAILSKYSDFKVGSEKRHQTNSFTKKIKDMSFDLLFFIIFCSLSIAWIIIYYDLLNNNLWLFISFLVVFSFFALSFLCILIMHIMSWIPSDKNFNPLSLEPIIYNNKIAQSKKIVDRFYKKHPEYERIC